MRWLLLLLLLAAPLSAETEADHEALRNLKTLYERAAAEGKPDALKPFLAEKFTGVMVTGDEVSSFDSLDAYFKKIKDLLGDGGKYSVTVKPAEKARFFGDVAIAYGSTDDVATTGSGREYKFTSSWTAVCVKEGGQWKILRVQGSMDPVANVFVKDAISGAGWLAGIGGAVGGLVLGLCGGLAIAMLKKKKTAPAA